MFRKGQINAATTGFFRLCSDDKITVCNVNIVWREALLAAIRGAGTIENDPSVVWARLSPSQYGKAEKCEKKRNLHFTRFLTLGASRTGVLMNRRQFLLGRHIAARILTVSVVRICQSRSQPTACQIQDGRER